MTCSDAVRAHEFDPTEDPKPREECGVFGVWAPGEEVAKLGGSVAVCAELSIMRDSLRLLAQLVRELFEGRSRHG